MNAEHKDLKYYLSTSFVKWFKQLRFAGRLRFKMLYWAYRLTGWHIRHREWDFVLDYLPSLGSWQSVSVLDVGCSRSLFCHEVVARGYKLIGIDLENPAFKYPGRFYKGTMFLFRTVEKMDFVTCISVFEHMKREEQNHIMYDMVENLKVGGRLLLTIPTHEFAQGHPWQGFSTLNVIHLIPKNSILVETQERAGQLCLCIERVCP